ncbi:phosphatidate cytidylyltransferase [Bacillus sp. FJAT-49736]|uniref:phosphatidate cytidylyltransferase n=1 Tax=Bacillus sp. FJAT-49736 TaxID=2833582 RepID=UPI001BC8CE99|nr:phosphatidate cytidylyltransferase [Bacillus sp. FJAT-49736]MBS4172550.1 phosphatidate cytidylyltransferase [Bacillus sp. FJAT-49736]
MKQRIITAVIAAAIFIPIVIYGGFPFTILVYLMAFIALGEALRMSKLKLISFPGIISFLMLGIFLIPHQYIDKVEKLGLEKMDFIYIGLLLLLCYTVASKNRYTIIDASFMLLSIFYVGFGFYNFLFIRESGLTLILYSLFIIWATDSGAYFIGRAMGKRKLWPEISPNKTVEGFFGGILCALIVAILFSLFSNIEASMLKLIIITAVLSVFGQMGDLVESALKRHYNVKDSGRILPGHGGILDRFDSLLFVWPLISYLLLHQ